MFYKVASSLHFYLTFISTTLPITWRAKSLVNFISDLAVLVDDVSGAQLVSRLIKRWSDENKVEINYNKCGIMELKRNQVEESISFKKTTLRTSPEQAKEVQEDGHHYQVSRRLGHKPNVLVDRICGINLQLRILHLRSREHDSRGH